MSDLYFNKESDYSEENTSDKRAFSPPFFSYFSLNLSRKNRVVMRATRKKLQKQLAVRRYSSK